MGASGAMEGSGAIEGSNACSHLEEMTLRQAVGNFQALLAERGYRVTVQRVAIYEYLVSTRAHPTAEDIYAAVSKRFPGLSRSTVYNTLELLSQLGLVTELSFGDLPARYDGNPRAHINLWCIRCHRIEDLEEPRLEGLAGWVQAMSGFAVEGRRHEFYGLCPQCQAVGERNDGHGEQPRGSTADVSRAGHTADWKGEA